MEPIIRLATLNDIEGILAIETRCFKDERFHRGQFRYLINEARGAFWVVEINHMLVGYTSVVTRSNTTNLRIYSLAIHPDYRGQKLGQQLISKAVEFALKCKLNYLNLEVKTTNITAIKLYQKMGFIVESTIKQYYPDGSDAFRMVRYLVNGQHPTSV